MTRSFLISVAIALITSYVAYQSREEIVTTLFAIVAVISLVLSFVIAPWPVQILILVVTLVGMRYFCMRHSCQKSLPS